MKNENILIVDDSSFVRDLLKRELLNYGYKNIYEGTNGEEGISLYKEISPSIIIMDTDMPIMNGFEALEKIKKIDTNAKVLILSEENIKEEALSRGAVGFFQKPFQPAYIWRKIDEINEAKFDTVEFEYEEINDKNEDINENLIFELEGMDESKNTDNEFTFELESITAKSKGTNNFTKKEEQITKNNSQEDIIAINNKSLYKEKGNCKISISPPRGEQYLLIEESLEERKKAMTKNIINEDELILNKKMEKKQENTKDRGFLGKIRNVKEKILKTIKQKG